MSNSGVPYLTSKEGILRFFIIAFGCVAFALIADSYYSVRGVIAWILAAYIISWCFSLLSYFFIATTLSSKMNCGIAYETVDVCLSVFSFFHCLLASIILTFYLCPSCDKAIAADVFGFLLSILYAAEIYFLRSYAPGNLSYLTTGPGILKALIFIIGCSTFALLDPIYHCFNRDCDSARTWSFAAYIYCWILSSLLLLVRLTGLNSKVGKFELIEMCWSIFSFLNYLVASIVLACYLECNNFNDFSCSRRLAAVIFGFFVSILYLIDAILSKKGAGGVSPN